MLMFPFKFKEKEKKMVIDENSNDGKAVVVISKAPEESKSFDGLFLTNNINHILMYFFIIFY